MEKLSAEIIHTPPEEIRKTDVTARAIYLVRIGYTKVGIKEYIESLFKYNLNRTIDEIRPTY